MARYGITNAQAKFLARLCRDVGIDYPGHGMTRDDARAAIDALIPVRDARLEAVRARVLAETEESATVS